MMFPIVLQDGDTFLQEPIGSDVPALPWPPPLTDTELVRLKRGSPASVRNRTWAVRGWQERDRRRER
jgi:hypothetical protein